jgi:electron transfer flavoprotein beta subunit
VIVVPWKWVTAGDDERLSGTSAADEAALEVALRLAAAAGDEVVAVSVGGTRADRGLRAALAVGATRAVRIDAPEALIGSAVALALAGVATGARWIVCGDVSADRGTGSVPAFLAAELDAAQALGLISVEAEGGDRVRAIRRLDGGRREVLDVTPPAVLSVEGAVARLRRASLAAELDARHARIEIVPGPAGPVELAGHVAPYRPRARQRPAPVGDPLARVRELTATGAGADRPSHAEVVTLDPPAAAARILAALRDWGYLERADSDESWDR